jgi:hypothetical protein
LLSALRWFGLHESYHDTAIPAGTEWDMAIVRKPGSKSGTVRIQQTSLKDTIREWGLTCYPNPPGNGVRKIPKATAALWRGSYPCEIDPEYKPADPKYKLTVITTSAIGWDDAGQLMFVFLKGDDKREVLSKDAQQKALDSLPNFAWSNCDNSPRGQLANPKFGTLNRANWFNASEGQLSPVPAEEVNGGLGGRWTLEELGASTHPKQAAQNKRALQHVKPLIAEMGNRFAEVLPKTFGHHKHKMRKIPPDFRLNADSPFTTYTLLTSAPAAIHVDANAIVTPHTKVSPATPTYALMTTVAPSDDYRGGEFCLVQYGLAFKVRPGDLLMAATSKHEHCNLSPVIGLKYSIVVYLKPQLTSPKVMQNYLARNAK